MHRRLLLASLLTLVACSDEASGVSDAGAVDAASDGTTPPSPDAGPATNRFGIPEYTFTIPTEAHASGARYVYVPDVQAEWPEVDWTTLDRLYLPAGEYAYLSLGNLPDRTPERPLVITNLGGQVRIGAKNHYYLFGLGGGANWILTGYYDPISLTGHADFPGHAGGNYANTRDRYGILVDDQFVRPRVNGLGISGGATDYTVEYLEIRHIDFAGLLLKTDDDGTATMRNVVIRDNYIHDTHSEGIYFGSTQPQPQHTLVDFEITNNRLIRTGTEPIQVGQVGGGHIHHNVFALGAIDWRHAFQGYQDSNLQMTVRFGLLEVDHNVIVGAANTLFSVFPSLVDGDAHADGDGVHVHDNYVANGSFLAAYMATGDDGTSTYRIERNTFGAPDFRYDEVYGGTAEPAELIRIANSARPIVLTDNRWAGGRKLTNRVDANGTNGNVSASGNVNGDVTPVAFRDFLGLPDDFDLRRLEGWTDRATLAVGDPIVTYAAGDVVMHQGKMYRALVQNSEQAPPADGIWEELPLPADDVRLRPGSPYVGIGLE